MGKRSPGAMNFMVGNWLSVCKAWLSAFPVYDINWSHLGSWLPSPFRIAGSGNCDSWCSCVKKKNLTASSVPLGLEDCVWWGGGRECGWQIPLLPGVLLPPKPPFLPRPLSLGPLALTCRLISRVSWGCHAVVTCLHTASRELGMRVSGLCWKFKARRKTVWSLEKDGNLKKKICTEITYL